MTAEKKISFVKQLNPTLIAEINEADLDDNPLTILQNISFPKSAFEDAKNLDEQLTVQNHDFQALNDEYLFTLNLANGFLHFDVQIIFSTEAVEEIKLQSLIRNYNTDALKIVALDYFIHYFLRENPTEATNTAAKILLNHFAEEEHDLPIILRAQFEPASYNNAPALSFKIGQGDHLYKIKSLPAIVDSVRKHRVYEAGKFFKRTLNESEMTDDSQAWYQLIERTIDSSDAVQEARDEFSVYSFKEIPLNITLADQIDGLLHNGVTLYAGNKRINYQIREQKLPLDLHVDETKKTVSFKLDYLVPSYDLGNLIRGSRNYYYFDANTWYRYENIDPNFLDRYGLEMGEELDFGPKTIQTLGRHVLPEMNNSGNFNISGMKKLLSALPPEAEFIFKLDFQGSEIVCQPSVKYGSEEYQLGQADNKNIAREIAKEEKAASVLDQLGFIKKQAQYRLAINASDKIDYFFDEGLNQLKSLGKVKITASFRRLLGNLKNKFNVSLGIRLGENTLDLTVAGEDLTPEDVQTILNAYQQKRHYVMLRNGQIHNVESPSIEDLSIVMKNLGLNLKQFVNGKMAVPAYRAFYLEKMLEGRNNLKYTGNDSFNRLINDLENGKLEESSVPEPLQKILRPYQVQGFKWLTTLINYRLGALLADEMGLGKTLQVISVLLSRKTQSNLPSLVIVPASVVYNWEAEIKKFAPDLETIVLDGSKKQRKEKLAQVRDQILITSYDSLKRDLEEYERLTFDLEVIDEAQNIKNAKSATAKTVKVINAHHRIALTGTPIENNLSELWSIFDYLMPGFLGEYEYFKNNYEKPIVRDEDEKAEKELSQVIAPFILRRLKKDVLRDLPDKNEQVVYAKMSGKQNDLYQAQTKKLILQLNKQDDKDFKKQRLQVLAEITKLRELCCDPHLLYEDYRGKSAKLLATLELISNSIEDGHKILLFSQFTSMLDIIARKLKDAKIAMFMITGATPKKKRQELIKEFNELDHPAIFLISLKAGGTGINLTSADVVIHYDPWWNIAAENQATDRAHRIGQKNNVQIYKMVAKGTIEEKIIELQERKEKLADEVLNGEKIESSTLDKNDLLNILER